MAEIVNLRQKRKEVARMAARAQANENAAKFGQTKAERALQTARADQARAHLDGHEREAPQGDTD